MPKIRQPRPRRGTKSTGKTTSVRVRLDGLITPAELRAMLNEAVDKLEALGLTHLRACFLCCTPSDARGERVNLVQDGRVVSTIAVEPPYRSAADELGI